MSESFVKKEQISYFQRLKNSFMGIFLGIILFLASFGVLYWNEGRVDLSKIASTAIEIPATGSSTANNGDFVSATGILSSEETLGDPPFLKPGQYVALKRKSEMYAWNETRKTETKKNTGGSETKTTTYTYNKTWTEKPENSAAFEQPNGHHNPAKTVDSEIFRVSQATVGNYQLELNSLQIPISTKVILTTDKVLPTYQGRLAGDYLYIGKGTVETSPYQEGTLIYGDLDRPTGIVEPQQIGDIRLSYQVLESNIEATIFGSLGSQNQLVAHQARKNVAFYRLFRGTREQAIQSLASQHKLMTWGLRLAGFLMMWSGLNLMVEPLGVLLDFVPFIGDLARTASSLVTFVISAILTSITIVISIILHNPIMVFLAIGLSGFILYLWTKRKKTQYKSVS